MSWHAVRDGKEAHTGQQKQAHYACRKDVCGIITVKGVGNHRGIRAALYRR